ncbi:MAG: hypothetical protein GPJ52_14875 [Candidatus Heimdallarchaeota archaeon]|nr:hypothetical protein [Candidatus Heimdallarchaeota archaeon]
MARDFSRIVVYGSTSAGKTTVTKELGRILNSDVLILDDVFWGPNWETPTPESFQKRVKVILSEKKKWVVDGNYSKVRPLVLPNATFAVFLHLPLYLILWRVFSRTISRNTIVKIHEPTPLPKRVEESGRGEHPIYSIYELSYYAIRNVIKKKIPGIIEEAKKELGENNYIVLRRQKDVDKFLSIIRKIEGQGTT